MKFQNKKTGAPTGFKLTDSKNYVLKKFNIKKNNLSAACFMKDYRFEKNTYKINGVAFRLLLDLEKFF